MKKILHFALCVLLLAVLLAGCDRTNLRVAFLLYDAKDTFIGELMSEMERNIPGGITYEIRDAQATQATQNEQIVELIENGVDLLVVNAVDRMACSAIVEKCEAQGVRVLFFNREPLKDAMKDKDVFYVGADADSLGRKQADMVADLFGDDFAGSIFDKNSDGVVQLVILKGEQGHQDAEKRTDNCIDRMRERGFEIEILAIEGANWIRNEGSAVMQRLHLMYGDSIELVFSNNDDMALGAIDYMTEIGEFSVGTTEYRQPFVIVGVDGTAVGVAAIQEGLLYGTVQNDSQKQSDAIITLIEYIFEGKSLESYPYQITNNHYIYIDGDVIVK